MEILPEVGKMIDALPMSSYTMVGNHDRNVANPDHMNDRFNAVFGADNYAFNYGNVHFIVLNNVFATGKNSYEGRLTDEQLTFLKNDLSYIPKDALVVLSQHIPMAFTRNRTEVLQLLVDYKNVLILSGHTHQVDRYFFKNKAIQELGAGATCGNWWRGEKDAKGVPDARMLCGSPRGYFVINIKNNSYSFQFKAVDQDAKKQMHIAVRAGVLLANVFGAADSTSVMVQINDGEWGQMRKSKSIDPFVSDIIEKNNQKIYPTLGSTANPLRKRASGHLWEFPLQNVNGDSIKVIRIKAEDNYGFSVQNEFTEFFSQ
jgi:3',5'-cyclic AMP phosphodiesterase CpdA